MAKMAAKMAAKTAAKMVSMIGVDPGELRWLRVLVSLLRHPDPLIAEMVQQALLYVEKNAYELALPCAQSITPPIAQSVTQSMVQKIDRTA